MSHHLEHRCAKFGKNRTIYDSCEIRDGGIAILDFGCYFQIWNFWIEDESRVCVILYLATFLIIQDVCRALPSCRASFLLQLLIQVSPLLDFLHFLKIWCNSDFLFGKYAAFRFWLGNPWPLFLVGFWGHDHQTQ